MAGVPVSLFGNVKLKTFHRPPLTFFVPAQAHCSYFSLFFYAFTSPRVWCFFRMNVLRKEGNKWLAICSANLENKWGCPWWWTCGCLICISPFTGRVLRLVRTARKYGYLFCFFFCGRNGPSIFGLLNFRDPVVGEELQGCNNTSNYRLIAILTLQ